MTNKDQLYQSALEYHRTPKPGKLEMVATTPLSNQRDLSLAYSPGVAAPCEEILRDPAEAATLTNRANLVAVITNGTAVLGLGDIGPLAAKPVMEGKAVLFKQFAGIDSVDIGIEEKDVDKLVETISRLEPSFGAINLEDIKAPECFELEEKLKQRMKIPVFHDDQHGTAIIVAAALINGAELVGKSLDQLKIVTSGAGASALACLELFMSLGVKKENIFVTDRKGIVHKDRAQDVDPKRAQFAQDTKDRTLAEALKGADVFLGLSAANILSESMVKSMAKDPLIFALANPTPEVDPTKAKVWRPDAILATGRSDYPNQVNNVLCFPFIFRGALDVGATQINEEMKVACVKALASLAKAESSETVDRAYGDANLSFGPEYIIPKPFDPRLIENLAPAVAKAAMDSGVATRPIQDLKKYAQELSSVVFRTSMVMRSVFAAAKENPKRICYAEGEDKRVLRAAQIVVDEGYAKPILIGRRDVVQYRIEQLGLRLKLAEDLELVDPEHDDRFKEYWTLYHELMSRKGVSPNYARTMVRTNTTVIGALMVKRGEADGLIAGPADHYNQNLHQLVNIIGLKPGASYPSSLNAMVLDHGVQFFMDAYVGNERTIDEVAEAVHRAAQHVRHFGIQPKVGLLSYSNFGTHFCASTRKMQDLYTKLKSTYPDLEVEGEMRGDAAIDEAIRKRLLPESKMEGAANLLVMPNLDAANIAYTLVKAFTKAQTIGPMLTGLDRPAHIVTPSVTARGILNMTAVTVKMASMSS